CVEAVADRAVARPGQRAGLCRLAHRAGGPPAGPGPPLPGRRTDGGPTVLARHFPLRPSLALVCGLALAGAAPAPARAGLVEYVRKPDPSFAWKLKRKVPSPLGTVYDLELVSQT